MYIYNMVDKNVFFMKFFVYFRLLVGVRVYLGSLIILVGISFYVF